MVLCTLSSLSTCTRLLLRLGSCRTVPAIAQSPGATGGGGIIPSVTAPELPLCLETSEGTKVPELWSCTKTRLSCPKDWTDGFAGSTRKHAHALAYQRTSGEVLWVIKKHKNLMTDRQADWQTISSLYAHLNTDFGFGHLVSLIKLELRNLITCVCVCVHVCVCVKKCTHGTLVSG